MRRAGARRAPTPGPLSVWVSLLVLGGLGGCGRTAGGDDTAATGAAVAPAPAPVTLDAPREGLAFRYLDPASGAVHTAVRLEDIPEAARGQVAVFDEEHPPPPGWDLVADLSAGFPAQATPRRDFQLDPASARDQPARPPSVGPRARASARAPGAPRAVRRGVHQVALFTRPGCGFCRKLRRFLRDHKVPFSEYDLETDPSATRKLRELANRAGLSPASLHGVPILFVDEEVVVGFDEPAVRRLLDL